MLSLHAISSAGQAESYYKSVNDYYAGNEEEKETEQEEQQGEQLIDEQGNQPHQHDLDKIMQGDNGEHLRSVFQGKGAELLGIEGFTKEQFADLLHGKLPDGTMLGKSGAGGEFSHRPGWDATLSAPKSVSIMALVAGDTAIIDAHHKAVENTLKFLEGTATNCRSADGKWVKTNNLTVASFTHSASRNLDAQLHTHNVIMNMTQDEQGKWRSLEPKAIYQIQKQAGAVYRAHLAHYLTHDLGYELTPKKDGLYEIKGVPLDLIDTMSSRSKEIDRIATEKGYEDAKGREQAALMTRSAKKNASNKSLNERWKEQSKEHDLTGLIPENRTQERAQEQPNSDQAMAAARYDVELAIKHLTTYEAVITKEAIFDFTLSMINGAYTPAHTEKVVDELIAKKTLMPSLVNRDGYEKGVSYTTPEAHRKESFALSMMEQGLNHFKAPVVSDRAIKSHIKAMRESAELHGTAELNHGQLEGMKNVLTSKSQFQAIQGYAGVGKTFLWRETKTLAEGAKHTVRGFAPTGSAAEKLFQDSGIKSQTIDSFTFQNQAHLNNGTKGTKQKALKADKEIWVIDEAGLANARHLIDMMVLARKSGARVVFQGDGAQLGAIEWGKLFKIFQEHGMQTSILDDILRQKGAVREAVYNVLDKDYKKAMANLGERVVQIDKAKGEDGSILRIQSLVEDWGKLTKEERDKALIIIPDLDSKDAATSYLRAELQNKGELGRENVAASILVDSKLSDPQKGDGRFYESGMIVQFNKDNKDRGISKGDRYTVAPTSGTNEIAKIILVSEKGERIEWNPNEAAKNRYLVDVYKTKDAELSVNDKIKWTKTNKSLGLRNGDKGKVISISKDQNLMTVEFDRAGKTITKTLDLTKDRTFSHGYIETAFGSQGLDSKHVFTIAESWRRNLVNEKSFYVKLSRTKDKIKIYTDNTAKLTKALERTGEKTSAIESQKGERAKAKQKSIEKKSELNWVKKIIDKVADKFKQPEISHDENHQQPHEKAHTQEHKESTQHAKEKETHVPEREAPTRSHERER